MSIWLAEAGFKKEIIGLFGLFGLPFSFKILWTPFIDHVKLPFGISQRKGWLTMSLLGMASSIFAMSFIDPSQDRWLLAGAICSLSLFTGCLYMVGIAYELESLESHNYGVGSAFVITGYRLGLLCAGGGALYFSSLWGWSVMFKMLSGLLTLGCFVILWQPEPFRSVEILKEKTTLFSSYGSRWKGFWHEIILEPTRQFFKKSHWLTFLLMILLFKVGDHLAKSMEGPFYLSLGFLKSELAAASKVWGMAATLSGAFLTGVFLRGRDPYICVSIVGCVHACTLICYYIISLIGKSMTALYLTVAIENLTAGMAMTSFIYLLWSICDKRYAAVQYALMWSFFSFKAEIIACLGGFLAANLSWPAFFMTVTGIGMSAALCLCVLVYQMKRRQLIAT